MGREVGMSTLLALHGALVDGRELTGMVGMGDVLFTDGRGVGAMGV